VTPPKDPRPRQPSRPELILDEQPERRVVHHPGVDGVPQKPPARTTLTDLPKARPPERKPTLTGTPPPPPPRLPVELAPTQRPALPWGKTVRAPSPPPDVAAARRTDPPEAANPPPTSIRVPPDETRASASLPPPSADSKDAQIAALRARAEAAEKRDAEKRDKLAELERQQRVQAEARSPATFPPAVAPPAPTPPAPTPPAAPAVVAEPATEAVIEWLVKRAVANRKAIYALVAALGLGGGGALIKTANDKPAPPALTKADLDAAFDRFRTRKGGTDDQTRMLNEQLQLTKCLRRKVKQIGESVLPAPDHMGSQRKPQPFEDDCEDSPRPLPDP